MIKAFLADRRGDAALWSAFLILLLTALSMVLYTAVTLYAKYQNVQTELERAANVTVDCTALNSNVRDIVLTIPEEDAIQSFESNLSRAGYVKSADSSWTKSRDALTVYQLEDMNMDIEDDIFSVSATLKLHIPWAIANRSYVSFPVRSVSRILYISN